MEKRIHASLLLSFYGAMLTERQQSMLQLYYEEDYSLSEIAALYAVTRQSAHDTIKRGEQLLYKLEATMGFQARWQHVCDRLSACRDALIAGQAQEALRQIDVLINEEEERNGI